MFRADLLQGRVVVVTGGGSGLGFSMAERAAGLGAHVGIIGRTEKRLQDAAERIERAGGRVAFAVADVRDPEAVHNAFDRLEGDLGPLDSLINNAAGNFLCTSEDLSPNAFNSVIQIVLNGTFHCSVDFGRRIISDSNRQGNILNIATTYSWTGSPFVLPSACAKAGVLAMTRSLAVEWATYGIRVNAIAPGPIPTKGAFSRLMAGDMEKTAKQRIPLNRFGTHREIADLATYLLAGESGFITGEVVTLDGGEWLQSGGEFAGLIQMDREQLKQMFQSMR
ncbi:MAG: SDR family oxidoreductase [Thermoanaerobaculia bacterium]